MEQQTITFEQPLNEHMRLCLRLEHLFHQLSDNMNEDSSWHSRLALSAMNEMLLVIDRPDLKSKLTKALSQHTTALTQLEQSPRVDSSKLREILDDLDRLIDTLYTMPGKIGAPLRENEFLTTIRQYSNNPGGASNFSLPAYQLWLDQPASQRIQTMNAWFKHFELLRDVVTLLLQLTRHSTKQTSKVAAEGFYQQALDPNAPCEMVRVSLPLELKIYPEISVGRHRMSVRFFHENMHGRARQVQEDVTFSLTCCVMIQATSQSTVTT